MNSFIYAFAKISDDLVFENSKTSGTKSVYREYRQITSADFTL